MTWPRFTLVNPTSSRLSIDAKLSEDRSIRRLLDPGTSFKLSPEAATLGELTRTPEIRREIDNQRLVVGFGDAEFSASVSNGPVVGWNVSLPVSFAPEEERIQIVDKMPFFCRTQLVMVTLITGQPLSLIRIEADGVDISGDIDTDGATSPSFAPQVGTLIRAGAKVEVVRLDGTAKSEAILAFSVVRLTV